MTTSLSTDSCAWVALQETLQNVTLRQPDTLQPKRKSPSAHIF